MNARALAWIPLLTVALAPAQDLAKLRKEIDAARKAEGVVGLSVAVVKDGKVVMCEGFGLRDAARRLPVTADTVFDIGSSTKAFTALLVAQAAQDGKLSLSDRPSKYLPAFRLKDPDANARITIEDMMSHRSGLPRTDLAWYTGAFSRDDVLGLVAEAEPTAPLGKAWQYQNPMFLFSGLIAAKAYGEPYETLLHERFFGPLGMTHSGATYAETAAERERATGYSGATPLPLKNIDVIAPAGSVSSTARDMAQYLRMLLADGEFEGKRLFAKAAVNETRKPRIAMPGGQYALGWMIGEEHGATSVFHGGNIDGYTAMVSLVPAKGIGVVVLSNRNNATAPTEIAHLVYDAFLPAEAKTVVSFEPATASEMGDYAIPKTPVAVSFAQEGKRVVMTQNGQRFPLDLVGPKRYTLQKALYLTFGIPGQDGKPTVRLEQGGATYSMVHPEPYKAPLAAADLLAKAVAAEGGADAIRRHARIVVHYHVRMPSDAVDVYGVRYRRDADSVADYAVLYGLNRRFADMTSIVADGRSIERTSFTTPTSKPTDDPSASLLADLEPTKFYKTLEIVREDKVGAEPVYVLRKTAFGGAQTDDYIAQKNFRVLRRASGAGLSRNTQEFSDFRTVDGLTMPFHSVVVNSQGGTSIEEILSVRFDEPIPSWPWDVR